MKQILKTEELEIDDIIYFNSDTQFTIMAIVNYADYRDVYLEPSNETKKPIISKKLKNNINFEVLRK